MIFRIFFVLLFFTVFTAGYGNVDFSNPLDVVSNAIEYFIKKDFSNLYPLTELAEKRRVEKTFDIYRSSDNVYVDREIENLESFKVLDVYYEGEFAIVSVNWLVKNFYQVKEGVKTYKASRKVLYLLKKFDQKWKIISKKVEI